MIQANEASILREGTHTDGHSELPCKYVCFGWSNTAVMVCGMLSSL